LSDAARHAAGTRDPVPLLGPGPPVLHISPITTYQDLTRLRAEWVGLFEDSGVTNPFAHPDWLIPWARHFVGPDDLHVLVVRSGGQLVGVAPFCVRSVPRFGVRVKCLRMLGAGRYSQLTEVPQVLSARGQSRRVLRAVVGDLCEQSHEWDWVELALGPGQGWFEREWIPHQGRGSGCVAMHKATRAFVVLPLAPTWDELRHSLKRNVKESIRRGANRLRRDAHTWRLVEPDGSEAALERSIDTLVSLHRARSRVQGTEPHADYFADSREEAFLYDAGRALHRSGHFTPLVLEVDGEEVAARLVLETGGSSFFSVSGADPAWWHYNVGTTLLALALERSIDRDGVLVNLSHGPDVSKLRWSEELEYAQSFLLVGERLRSRVAFAAFWHARAEYMRRDQRRRHAGSRRALPDAPPAEDTPPTTLPFPVFLD
jgi:CelD/BcsL family acetyltransferase involved in cellulose biosynthesis